MIKDGFYNMDCFDGMAQIDDHSIDMILCDPPYGKTQCPWDMVIPAEPMWEEFKRITKERSPILIFGMEPFSSYLRVSNIKMYKYDWIWDKVSSPSFLNAKKQPMRCHELISVFYRKQCKYHPQMTKGHDPVNTYTKHKGDGDCYGKTKTGISGGGSTERYPRSIQVFSKDTQKCAIHPTQKPVALCEYLIRTYTDPGDLVLDSTAGSCTTGVACANTGRRFIGFEKDGEIYRKGKERLMYL